MKSRVILISVLLLICACPLAAGELSDSLIFGNTRAEAAHGLQGGLAGAVSALVGTVHESTTCRASTPAFGSSFQFRLRKQPGQLFTLQIQEVYPPESPGVRYRYEVRIDGKLVYIRDYVGLMVGTVSYFINIDDPEFLPSSEISLTFTNTRGYEPFRISGVWLFSDFAGYCQSSNFDVPFYLNPLLDSHSTKSGLEAEFAYLKNNVAPIVNPSVRLGCAQEHYYMHKTAYQSQQQFTWLLDLARKYDMPYSPLMVSWWAGTPLGVPDGLGGTFGDPKYQQVCWSITDFHDEGQALRDLLGSKWDMHYGWTVPNMWSNTPWLTMNSTVLNNARATAIASKMSVLKSVLSDPRYSSCASYLLAITMENEPRYWDYHCPDQDYPIFRYSLWGDFNPMTVADAAADGVVLDPVDGLSYEERMWLHTNVARYQQQTYDAYGTALRNLNMPFINSSTDSFWQEIYSHAFPSPVYPMDQVTTYHPGLEWNRLKGCRPGLEDVANPAVLYLEKAREWGRWAQVNYEENNGLSTDIHLRALRVCHAFGARFYNFYNWQRINSDNAWINYVRQFCAQSSRTLVAQQTAMPGAGMLSGDLRQVSINAIPSAGYFNKIELTLGTPGEYILRVYDNVSMSRLLAYRTKTVPAAGLVRFHLPNCVPLDGWPNPCVVITRSGNEVFTILTNPDGRIVHSAYADSARERIQSLMICWRADAQTLLADLRAKGLPGLETAEHYFAAGDYRRAYEAAAQVDAAYPNGVADIIIDNDEPGFTSTGNWWPASTATAYNGNYRLTGTTSNQNATATWRPSIKTPGCYDVFIWYPVAANRSAAAPFTIQHRGGTTTVHVDQNADGGQWLRIASGVPFDAGTAGCVTLGNGTGETGKSLVADAVKFDYVSPLDLTPPQVYSVSTSPAIVAAGDSITVTVDVEDNVAVESVTVNDAISLQKSTGDIWTGSIPANLALGPHTVTVVARDAFGNLSETAQAGYLTAAVVGVTNRSLHSDNALALVVGQHLVKAWGCVTGVDGDYFTFSDGSSHPVRVCCPGHGLETGDFVTARGIWNPFADPATLTCQPSGVQKR